MSKCCDVMNSDPLLCLPCDPVGKLAQLMLITNTSPVLIIEDEESRRLAGIVTERDLALKIVAVGRDPKSATAEDVMTRKVVTCTTEDDIEKAFDIMTMYRVPAIPVVDNNDRLVGVLQYTDVEPYVAMSKPSQDPATDLTTDRPAKFHTI
jgi:CBS domain-containing protein